jgi:gamma-glutamylcyclotransferase (GGCT)/AIG2-like uncharacterized protein YtfP
MNKTKKYGLTRNTKTMKNKTIKKNQKNQKNQKNKSIKSSSSVDYIFFYGTLRKGEFNNYKIKENRDLQFIGNAMTKNKFSFFKINHTNLFPFITNQKYKNHKKVNVDGDLYKINHDKTKLLHRMDKFEKRYKRGVIQVMTKDNEIHDAFVYFMKDKYIKDIEENISPNGLKTFCYIESGDYLHHNHND